MIFEAYICEIINNIPV